MNYKSIHIHRILCMLMLVLIFTGCKEDIYEPIAPSAGIFIAPTDAERQVDERQVTISDDPVSVAFTTALYKPASSMLQVQVAVNEELVARFNTNNGTSYKLMPEGSVSFSKDIISINKGETASDSVDLILNTAELLEGVNYLVPLTIVDVSGTGVELNSAIATKYYSFKGTFPEI